ncbi:uncharacterized protein LOC144884059 isoform X3 [Branchiostoma floridae x Branchiostoma japonicum]
MLPSKHSAPKYGWFTTVVAMAACVLSIVTMVTMVVVVLEVRNLRSELQETKLRHKEAVPDGTDFADLQDAKSPDGDTETDPGKESLTGKENYHRSKRSANSITMPFGSCLQGPPGPPVVPGRDGLPGRDGTGQPGRDGRDAAQPGTVCPENPACPSGYVKFQDSCFKFSSDQKNYSDARSACQAAGGLLAMPKDVATNNFLVNQLTRYHDGSNAWFGLTDLAQEGTFVWEDGTLLTGWSNWYPGQPDNANFGEDCALWKNTYGYKWNDEPITGSYYYVCEVSIAVL